MPSPFPGVDPYLECADWEDFHTTFNTVMRELLVPLVRPHYLVRVERRVYVDHEWEEELSRQIRPDVALIDTGSGQTRQPHASTGSVMLERQIPMPREREETYLVIRSAGDAAMICVIETLSPSNKRPGSDGRRAYMQNRDEILASQTHLVEIDFLRGGSRLPILGGDIPGDHYVVVSPSYRRPRVEVYSWSLRDPIPDIQIPLRREDGAVPLPLQTAHSMVYDRADYAADPNLRRSVEPPLRPEDAAWAAQVLASG
jgi:hypothetical protein